MATVTVTWNTKTIQVPAPTDLEQYRVAIDSGPAQMVPLSAREATFDDITPGTYVVRVALSNADGTHLEGEQATEFSVSEPPVDADAPDLVTVAVG
jgi:hypothetical protein